MKQSFYVMNNEEREEIIGILEDVFMIPNVWSEHNALNNLYIALIYGKGISIENKAIEGIENARDKTH